MSPSTRDRPAKAPLSREVIVSTALHILDQDGLSGLSLRRVAAALDTGAYYFAHHYAYNSLARPGIYGFAPDGAGGIAFATVREPQSLDEIVAESGGAHTDSLTTLRAPDHR